MAELDLLAEGLSLECSPGNNSRLDWRGFISKFTHKEISSLWVVGLWSLVPH